MFLSPLAPDFFAAQHIIILIYSIICIFKIDRKCDACPAARSGAGRETRLRKSGGGDLIRVSPAY
jgi:hypothetical protein